MSSAGDPAATPYPYDHYPSARQTLDAETLLTPFRAGLVLSAFAPGSRIVSAVAARGQYLPCPVRVTVAPAAADSSGADCPSTVDVYLRLDRLIGGVAREAQVLPVLGRLGLPVPRLLAGPVVDPDRPEAGPVSVISALPGQDLLRFVQSSNATTEEAPEERIGRGIDLLLEALRRLHALTPAVEASPLAQVLPRRTLLAVREAIETRGGPWLADEGFVEALRLLRPLLARIETPLAFSNGDYNPGNFLVDRQDSACHDGQDESCPYRQDRRCDDWAITGFVDFAHACFEDPHIGLAKCRIYDWWPWRRAGLVERYLEAEGLTTAEFAPRLALQCLGTLQREVSVTGAQDADYRAWLRCLLDEALADAL
ncbi:MAG: phosphotransferase family protein [Anaerolineae bacterium]